ncbi:hypothetical protein BT69DRAFT_1345602 [Atractiella rhizophila]|nr:hypothetical protein BT69DRAFT_1345602 [Atractiella rhizophila]
MSAPTTEPAPLSRHLQHLLDELVAEAPPPCQLGQEIDVLDYPGHDLPESVKESVEQLSDRDLIQLTLGLIDKLEPPEAVLVMNHEKKMITLSSKDAKEDRDILKGFIRWDRKAVVEEVNKRRPVEEHVTSEKLSRSFAEFVLRCRHRLRSFIRNMKSQCICVAKATKPATPASSVPYSDASVKSTTSAPAAPPPSLPSSANSRNGRHIANVCKRDNNCCRVSGIPKADDPCQVAHLLPWKVPSPFWPWISRIFGAEYHEAVCDTPANMILIHSSVHARVGSFQVWFERDESNNLILHLRNGGNKFDSAIVTDYTRMKDLPRGRTWTARDDALLQEMIDLEREKGLPGSYGRTYHESSALLATTVRDKDGHEVEDISGMFAFYHKALGDVIWMSGAARWLDDANTDDDEDVDPVRSGGGGGGLQQTKTWVEDQRSLIQRREIERVPTPIFAW